MRKQRMTRVVGLGVLALTVMIAAPARAEVNFNVEAFRPSRRTT
jgi:hypothetical protein